MHALISGNSVLYSNGTKETIKKQSKPRKPRKKEIKVGMKVMVNFNPEIIAIVTGKDPRFVKTHEQQVCNDPDGLQRGWFEFKCLDGRVSRCHKSLLVAV